MTCSNYNICTRICINYVLPIEQGHVRLLTIIIKEGKSRYLVLKFKALDVLCFS